MDISEKNLEDTIEAALLAPVSDSSSATGASYSASSYPAGGYQQRTQNDYDKTLCILKNDTLNFISTTQSKEWQKFVAQYAGDHKKAEEQFFERLSKELHAWSTPDVLRKGIKTRGCHFMLAYYRPSSTLNPSAEKLYGSNIFSVVRQLHYSLHNNNSLDLALFLNGLPIFTAELKNRFTRQSAEKNAISQYRKDRDASREPLFAFGRCLAHFAIDPDVVFMTTQLQGNNTDFIPFNQGYKHGAGNPPADTSFATAYLWEHIWARNSVLNLVQHFVHVVEEKQDASKKTRKLLFPRYHQLETVRRILADALMKGAGQSYLIEHSAGSGKSNTLSWLAYQLSLLHDEHDKRIFDSIIVISDRRILDQQLQETIQQFAPEKGILENINKTSKQLKKALEDGITIIVTTIQKFPVIVKDMQALKGKRFAVIIDEAHSSQTGSSSESMKRVFANGNLEEGEQEENTEPEDTEDRVEKVVKAHGPLPNVSYFAFTATPKDKTLRLFGTQRPDGSYEAFSLYSMRQAIEEGYILDVLQNYVTYKAYWRLQKKAEEDPHYDRTKAAQQLMAFVEADMLAIEKKVAIIAEHFKEHSAKCINGKAKAMIVARSRKQAVRYKLALDKYLRDHSYTFKTLVAFSGTVHDGINYTESGMNGFPDSRTAETFKQNDYRFLIVADKFQTGFDQPLLHTMYVDKKLTGVHAVQTLSRLNRVYHPFKKETLILDFANEVEDIRQAFAPYYEKTTLISATDPDSLYDLQTRLDSFHFYTQAEIDIFADTYFNDGPQHKLYNALAPAVERFEDAAPEAQTDFRGQLNQYIDLYSFLSQVATFSDNDLEKLYRFAQLLSRKLPLTQGRISIDAYKYVDLKSYELKESSSGSILLSRNTEAGEIEPGKIREAFLPAYEESEPISQIIDELNQFFGSTLTEEDRIHIQEMEEKLVADSRLEAAMRVNSESNARLTFDEKMNEILPDMTLEHLDSLTSLFKNINSNEDFKRRFLDLLFERFLEKIKQSSV